jgi:hypothetical protein
MKLLAIILILVLSLIILASLKVASDADNHAETMRYFKEEK